MLRSTHIKHDPCQGKRVLEDPSVVVLGHDLNEDVTVSESRPFAFCTDAHVRSKLGALRRSPRVTTNAQERSA